MTDNPEPISPAPLKELFSTEPTIDDMTEAVSENTPAHLPAKGFLRSKTVWGAILTLIAAALSTFLGVDVELVQFSGRLADGITMSDVLIILGATFATYGRVSATSRIKGLFGGE